MSRQLSRGSAGEYQADDRQVWRGSAGEYQADERQVWRGSAGEYQASLISGAQEPCSLWPLYRMADLRLQSYSLPSVFFTVWPLSFCSSSKDGFIFPAQTTCPSLHTFVQLPLLRGVLSLPSLPGLVGRHSFCQKLFQTP